MSDPGSISSSDHCSWQWDTAATRCWILSLLGVNLAAVEIDPGGVVGGGVVVVRLVCQSSLGPDCN